MKKTTTDFLLFRPIGNAKKQKQMKFDRKRKKIQQQPNDHRIVQRKSHAIFSAVASFLDFFYLSFCCLTLLTFLDGPTCSPGVATEAESKVPMEFSPGIRQYISSFLVSFFFFLLDVVYSVLRLFKTMYVLCVVCYIHVGMYVYRLYIIDDFRPVVHGTHSNSFRFFSFSGFRAPVRFSRPDRRRTRGGGRDHTTNDVAIGHAIFSQSTVYIFFFFLGRGRVCFLVPLDNRAREF